MKEFDFAQLRSETVGVAVSGGADSMCLLDILAERAAEYNFEIVVVNVEHGIRGDSSLQDSAFVRSFCVEHGYEIMSFSVDSPAFAAENSLGEEEAARILRYRCFEDLLSSRAVDVIATAHHASDQTETILLRIARGTGIAGLVGIPERRGSYVRPLLNMTREDILEYVRVNNIPYVDDETNMDVDYNRNYFRHRVIPAIRARFPDVDTAVGRLTADAYEADKYICEVACRYVHLGDPYFGTVPLSDSPMTLSRALPNYFCAKSDTRMPFFDIVALPVALLDQPAVIRKRAIAIAFKCMGEFHDIESRHIEIISDSFAQQTNYTVDLPFDIRLYKEYSDVVLCRRRARTFDEIPWSRDLDVCIADRVWSICPAGPEDRLRFDAAAIPPEARLRTRRAGDIFTSFSGHTDNLGDWFTDKKIPTRLRDDIPVLAIGDRILAVGGLELCPQLKITKETNINDIYTIRPKGVAYEK